MLESTGADVYVYFTKDFGSEMMPAELRELAEDAGTSDTGGSGDTMDGAAGGGNSTAREGHESELWADLRDHARVQPRYRGQHHPRRPLPTAR